MPVITLPELLEAGVHFGHQTRRWHPAMAPYIYTSRNGVHIIDLVQTAQLMEEAYRFVNQAAARGQKVMFVGTKRQAAGIIAQEAARCSSFFVNQRWLGGMLTNWETIKTRVERLKELERLEESGALERRPKKEAAVLRRELDKLQKYLGGIKTMRRLPDIVVVVDQRREYNAVTECQKLGIPIVSLLDTNCDPSLTDIPIPANDDAIRSIKLIVGRLADAIYEGRHGSLDAEVDEEYGEFEDALEEYGEAAPEPEEEAPPAVDDAPVAVAATAASEATEAAEEPTSSSSEEE